MNTMQEIPSIARGSAGAGQARVQQAVIGQHAGEPNFLNAVQHAVEKFRRIEGERMLCELLEQLLGKSKQALHADGVPVRADGSAELASLHAQLRRLQEINERGSAEHKRLQDERDEYVNALQRIAAGNMDASGQTNVATAALDFSTVAQ